MKPAVSLVAPDHLVIREGGGCIAIFGLPFFVAGLGLLAGSLGLLADTASDPRPWARPALFFMGLVFTAVGGGLVFGRQWTTIDRAARVVRKQQGLLIPLRETITPLDACTTVSMGFVEGDSDSADRFPVTLKDGARDVLTLSSFTDYGQARACAAAVAQHLALSFEDASSDHVVQMNAGTMAMSFRERVRKDGLARREDLSAPPDTRTVVTREADRTTIVIPNRPSHPLTLLGSAVPIVLLIYFGRGLLPFMRQAHTPEGIMWAFGGFFLLVFGLPTISAMIAFLRSRRGATIVQVSREGLRVDERRAWTTKNIALVESRDILDLDYNTRSSRVSSARRLATQHAAPSATPATPTSAPAVGPGVEKVISLLSRLATGKGVIVKTTGRIITFAQGLDDDETRYVYGVVRRALTE